MPISADHADRMASLPPTPLRDEQLTDLLDTDRVLEVWVPENRPDTVTTGDGTATHDGDILDFWIELHDKYVPLRYTSVEGVDGVAWYSLVPTAKDEPEAEMIAATIDEYQPLSERL